MEIIQLKKEDDRFPKRLLKIKQCPNEIYAVGNIKLLNYKNTIGIVGSRECSEYGRKASNEFAGELSAAGICVISGLAIGIDGIAHNAAIEGKGKTVAILGSGFNYIYPQENEWLFHKIIKNGGCAITEHAPNVEPSKNKFPKRNRLISGLADAVLVVEASYRSGSSITARYAKEEGKQIYAIPSNIYSSKGIGTNILIQNGAKLVTKPAQIIEEIKINEDVENKIAEQEAVPKEYLHIYKLLSDVPIHINEISRKLGKTIQDISPIITMMEIEGYAYQPQNSYFVKI